MKDDIRKLILDAQGGNANAFHELVATHDEKIMTLALQLTKNKQDAEDLYQEVFIRAYKNIRGFRFKSEFYTWLYRITVNTFYNMKRKTAKMKYVEPEENRSSDHMDAAPDPALSSLESYEIRQAVKSAASRLPAKQKSVFILKHFQQLKIREIAGIMDIAEGTVKKYLFRAMEKLREDLKEYRYA